MAKEHENPIDDPEEAIQDASKRVPQPPNRRGPRREELEDEDNRRPRRSRDPQEEGRPRRRPPQRDHGDEGGAISTLIPYRNGMALASYYCGVFALIPCVGVVLGIIAIILGIMGLGYVKRQPEAKGTGHAITGIVLGSFSLLCHLGGALFIFLIAPKH